MRGRGDIPVQQRLVSLPAPRADIDQVRRRDVQRRIGWNTVVAGRFLSVSRSMNPEERICWRLDHRAETVVPALDDIRCPTNTTAQMPYTRHPVQPDHQALRHSGSRTSIFCANHTVPSPERALIFRWVLVRGDTKSPDVQQA